MENVPWGLPRAVVHTYLDSVCIFQRFLNRKVHRGKVCYEGHYVDANQILLTNCLWSSAPDFDSA